MNKFARKFLPLAVAAATAASMMAGLAPAHGAANVTVNWFVGLGTGTNDQQIAAEKKVVDEFNSSVGKDKGITLAVQFGANFQTSMDTITTLIASGNAPDIAGPVGVGGSNALADQWMDLKPLIDKNKYDMTQFDPSVLSLYQTLNGGYSAIPFAVYPSILYYNTALFDEAGLKYPPTKVGDQYTFPDGTKADWNYTTLGKVAKMLTVDKAGNDATSSKFDPKNIVQYGMNFQWALMRLVLADIQPSAFYDAASNKVKISDDWRKAAAWVQAGVWKDHYISSATAEASTLLQPSAFDSGHLAMAITPLWYTCCLTDTAGKLKWNIAVVPQSLDGKTHDAVDADTFRVFKSTKNPDATFTVLTYLEGTAVPELADTYGAFPALAKYQQPWIDGKNKTYTQGVNWSVATDMLKYTNPSNLHHESNSPHFQQVEDRFASFYTTIFGDTGATVDVNAEMDKLEKDLQSIVNGTFPTSTPVPTPTPAPTKAAS
ncbi:MAG TPA: extracellular solute-binding protein [Aggregatilineales bacterium]|nr:extracellular solute-binding protein [Aggregatilineales bacterium]